MKIILTLALATLIAFIACTIQIASCAHTGLVITLMAIAVVLIMLCDEVISNED